MFSETNITGSINGLTSLGTKKSYLFLGLNDASAEIAFDDQVHQRLPPHVHADEGQHCQCIASENL